MIVHLAERGENHQGHLNLLSFTLTGTVTIKNCNRRRNCDKKVGESQPNCFYPPASKASREVANLDLNEEMRKQPIALCFL